MQYDFAECAEVNVFRFQQDALWCVFEGELRFAC